ncbi:MAG: hypothetical protein R2752_13515 [Vicinamibacterales bacterium]
MDREWQGAQGLAEDALLRPVDAPDEVEKRIGHLLPEGRGHRRDEEGAAGSEPYAGRRLTIAWLWARTVKSPNPAFANIDAPLRLDLHVLSTKAGKKAYVEPVIEKGSPSSEAPRRAGYRFTVKVGEPKDAAAAKNGTKASGRGANFL